MALSTFLLVALGLATASLSIASALTRAQIRVEVTRELDSRLTQVASLPFDALVANSFTAPDACTTDGAVVVGSSNAHSSCFYIGAKQYTATYDVSLGSDPVSGIGTSASYVEVTGSVAMSDGGSTVNVTRTRRVPAPVSGYAADAAVVRIRLATDGFDLPVVVVDRNGTAVSDALRFVDGVAVARVKGGACIGSNAPCRVGLQSGAGWFAASGWTLSPSDIAGSASELYLSPGTLSETVVSPSLQASAIIQILAQPTAGGPAQSGAAANSVCLWATFDNALGRISTPFCNTSSGQVVVDSFRAPNGQSYPLSDGAAFTLTVDNPDGSCPTRASYPALSGLVGATASGWTGADVCTGWTWGAPTLFGLAGNTPLSFTSPPSATATSVATNYQLVWTATDQSGGAVGRPAAGSSAVEVWSKPRAASLAGPASGCATDNNAATLCTSPVIPTSTPVPESAPGAPGTCATNAFCLSQTAVAPALTTPASPFVVSVASAATATSTVSLGATDADGNPVSLTILSLPASGTLQQRTATASASALSVGQTLSGQGASSTWDLLYTVGQSALSGFVSFQVRVVDSTGASVDRTVTLTGQVAPFVISVPSVSINQGQASQVNDACSIAVCVSATVTDTSGAFSAGTTVTFATSNTSLTLSSQTANTDSTGVATVRLSAGALAAGTYQVTATLPNGRSTTASVVVSSTLGSLAVTPSGSIDQGASGTATVTARDQAGTLMSGAVVTLRTLRSGSQVSAIRSGGPCVTAAGICTVPVNVSSAVAATTYVLEASSVNRLGTTIRATGSLTVTAALSQLVTTTSRGQLGRYGQSVLAAGPSGYWKMDEQTGTSVADSSGNGYGATISTNSGSYVRNVVSPLGAATTLNATGADVSASATPARLGYAGDFSLEAWVKPLTLTPTGGSAVVVSSQTTNTNGFRLGFSTVSANNPGTRWRMWSTNDGGTLDISGGTIDTAALASWHHVVATRVGSTTRLYVDGVQVASGTGTIVQSTANTRIGGSTAQESVSHVAVYPYGLSDAQVANHYALGGVSGGAQLSVAQGSSTPVTVFALDANGSAMSGVSLSASGGTNGVSITPSSSVTSVDGSVTFSLTAAQSALATRTTDNPNGADYPSPPVITGPNGVQLWIASVTVTPVLASLQASPAALTGGGSVQIPVTARDRAGVVMSGVAITPSLVSDSALSVEGSPTTNAVGIATLTVRARAGASSGANTLTLTAGSVSTSVTVTVTSAPYTVTAASSTATLTQGSTGSWPLVVRDGNGSGVEGVTLSAQCTNCGLSFASSVTSNADGRANLTVTVASSAATNTPIPVTVSAGSSATFTVYLTIGANAASMTVNNGADVSLRAGRSQVVAVVVRDAAGQPAAGVTVWGDSPVGGVSVTGAVTDSSGRAYLLVGVNSSTPVTTSSTLLRVYAGQASAVARGAVS